jgi:cytochrome b561
MLKNSLNTYGSIAKILHWTIGILIIFMLFLGYLMKGLTLLNYHKLVGLVILALVVLRVLWRLSNKQPTLPASMPFYEKFMANLVHYLIYICILAIPLSGWAMATSANWLPHIGSVSFAMPFIPISTAVNNIALLIHNTLVKVIIGLLFLHILGALRHHFIIKDNILRRMLPNCCCKCKRKSMN